MIVNILDIYRSGRSSLCRSLLNLSSSSSSHLVCFLRKVLSVPICFVFNCSLLSILHNFYFVVFFVMPRSTTAALGRVLVLYYFTLHDKSPITVLHSLYIFFESYLHFHWWKVVSFRNDVPLWPIKIERPD